MAQGLIHTGLWQNYDQPGILGATLTVSASTGILLSSFLALFISWAGMEVWSLLSFTIHQCRSRIVDSNALYHQQQVLLREDLTDWKFLWLILKTVGAWRKVKGVSIRGSLVLALLAFLHAVLFTTASLFSASVATANGEVLVKSTNCGSPSLKLSVLTSSSELLQFKEDDINSLSSLYLYGNWMMEQSLAYSKNCYADTSASQDSCSSFITRSLASTVLTQQPCPFPGDICREPAISIDSGYIDSSQDLGINSKYFDRLKFRRSWSCAPIDGERYSSEAMTEAIPVGGLSNPRNTTVVAKTYDFRETPSAIPSTPGAFSGLSFVATNLSDLNPNQAYTTFALASYTYEELVQNQAEGISNVDEFNSDLNRNDSDVTVWILQPNIVYTGKVGDPFYEATSKIASGLLPLYKPDRAASFIGCVEQFTYCNGDKCTNPSNLRDITPEMVKRDIAYNDLQMAVFNLTHQLLQGSRLGSMLGVLQEKALLSQAQLLGPWGVSAAVPANQWQLEVHNMFNISSSVLQHIPLDYVSPPRIQITKDVTTDMYLTKPETAAGQDLCQRLKIRSGHYYSFNFFGLMVILVLGSLAILANKAILPLVLWRQTTGTTRSQHKRTEWESNNILQLQSHALEGQGIGPWTNRWDVPILVPGSRCIGPSWMSRKAEDEMGAKYCSREVDRSESHVSSELSIFTDSRERTWI